MHFDFNCVSLRRLLVFGVGVTVLWSSYWPAQALVLSISDPLPQVRTRSKENVLSKHPFKSLAASRKAEIEGDFGQCLKHLNKAASRSKEILPWVTLAKLRCAYQDNSKTQVRTVLNLLKQIDRNREWLVLGAYASKMRAHVLEARFAILEPLLKTDRSEAVRVVEELLALTDWMDSSQKAQAYRIAGEAAFIQQKLKKAETYFMNSLKEKETSEARDRLNSLKILLKEKASETPVAATSTSGNEDLAVTPKEKQIADRVASSIRSGDLVAAAEDSLELIRSFPGSQKARWASDRVFEVYHTIASKHEQKYQSLRGRIIDQMEKADGLRISAWAQKAYRLGYFADVITLSEAALKKLEGTTNTTLLLAWLAHGHLYTGEEGKAKKQFQVLVEKHAGTPESFTALFRLALIEYRAKDYASAIAHLERLLAIPSAQSEYELQARYWLWRATQKTDEKRAEQEATMLVERFPLTYYGLRAQAELSQNQLSLPTSAVKLRSRLDLYASERQAWDRAQFLLKAGWNTEAQLELAELLEPADAMTKALISRYWASAMGYNKALRLMNVAWNQDPSLQIEPLIKVVYPFEFRDNIEAEAKKYNIESHLIWSLIRQESAFESRAVSSSGAMGLMQLIPSTGQEVATDLRLKSVTGRESFFVPALNVQMGTYYLNKMLKKFEGNVAWALAAYNAGPGRFGRWIRTRGVPNTKTSNPEDETWMDELPWSETNFYVKAILRNLLIYRALDRGRVPLPNPVWAYEAVEKK